MYFDLRFVYIIYRESKGFETITKMLPGFPHQQPLPSEQLPTASKLLNIIRSAQELDQAGLMKQALDIGIKDEDIISTLARLIKEKQIGYFKDDKKLRFFSTDTSIVASGSAKQKKTAILTFIKETRERGVITFNPSG